MNFHISNLSPLRPQFSSSSLSASRSLHGATSHHDNTTTGSGPVRIAVEPAEEPSSSADSDDSTDSLSSDSAADEVTQDSRDVLAQRLSDLAERIGGANVRAACIEALHRQVDEMERFLRGSSRDRSSSRKSHASASSRRRRGSLRPGSARPRSLQLPTTTTMTTTTTTAGGQGSGSGDVARGRESLGVMAPMSPSWLMSHFQRRPSVHQDEAEQQPGHGKGVQEGAPGEHRGSSSPRTGVPETQLNRPSVERMVSLDSSTPAPRISSQVAEDAIKEAEKLCAEMATVIESLQTRREESAHLQTVLIEREEVAHQHLHQTALVTQELEDVVADNEAELRHLRLELRAIEVQCMGYVPKGADPKLDQSIRNWKEDWHALRDKYALRRGTSFVSGDGSSTTNSTMASPVSQR